MKKIETIKTVAIFILAIAGIFFAYKYYTRSQKDNFISDTDVSLHNVSPNTAPPFWKHQGDILYGKLRDNFINEGFSKHGVWYDTGTIRTYLDKIFPSLINNMDGINDPNYKWGVGFYFLKDVDAAGNKIMNFLCDSYFNE